MRNIPIFSTKNGTGNLILREIPYSAAAYVRILDTADAAIFLEECVHFCAAAGAKRVYGTGHPSLRRYPLHTAIVGMRRSRAGLPETDAVPVPVTGETLEDWRGIYNVKMARVPNAAYMTLGDAIQMRHRGDGYFVCRAGARLGIGVASGETLKAVAATAPGAGRDVVLALATVLQGEQITLEVASANQKAVALYEGLGFEKTALVSEWYRIF